MEAISELAIGKQVWALKNLCVTKFQNGDLIPEVKSNEEWETAGIEGKPAFCYYNNDSENGKKYGILYNWFAVIDPRKIEPEGWRIPVKSDWEGLINYLGGEKNAGRKMKSTSEWLEVIKGKDGNGTNECGFNAYPGGNRNFIGKFSNKGLSCSWWCLNSNNAEENLFYYIVSERDTVNNGVFDIEDGLYVRLIKV